MFKWKEYFHLKVLQDLCFFGIVKAYKTNKSKTFTAAVILTCFHKESLIFSPAWTLTDPRSEERRGQMSKRKTKTLQKENVVKEELGWCFKTVIRGKKVQRSWTLLHVRAAQKQSVLLSTGLCVPAAQSDPSSRTGPRFYQSPALAQLDLSWIGGEEEHDGEARQESRILDAEGDEEPAATCVLFLTTHLVHLWKLRQKKKSV